VVSGDNYHGSNDRSNGAHTTPDQEPRPIDWVAVAVVGVFVALVIFGVLFVRA
jgi:hypothetical protein